MNELEEDLSISEGIGGSSQLLLLQQQAGVGQQRGIA